MDVKRRSYSAKSRSQWRSAATLSSTAPSGNAKPMAMATRDERLSIQVDGRRHPRDIADHTGGVTMASQVFSQIHIARS